MQQITSKWNEILDTIKKEHDLSDVSFDTWLKPLEPFSIENNVLTILVPSGEMGLNYISRKYILPLRVTITEQLGIDYDIKFILPEAASKTKKVVKKTITMNDNEERSNLNPNYKFDSFVVGSNNRFAHSASLAVAESPGEVYNPLFLYGGVGLGKTHLMHSIAHFILKDNPDAKILYVTSEEFTNELIESIRNGNDTSMAKFREKYRSIDVLLVDDIQFISGKESTQEEFFHTFNSLYGAKKHIVLSSDKPPKDLETLELRLRTRFEMGLIADIQSPDYETRMAILRKKEETEGYSIDDEIIQYIATNIKSNIRELEGALNKLIAYHNLEKKELTLEIAMKELQDIISPDKPKEITPKLIIEIVAEHFHVSASDIASQKRNSEIAHPRQIAMYLCRQMTEAPLKSIGMLLGKRDHTTILHGIDKITKEMLVNESTINAVDIIKKKINPS